MKITANPLGTGAPHDEKKKIRQKRLSEVKKRAKGKGIKMWFGFLLPGGSVVWGS